jgi:hypothetical protein
MPDDRANSNPSTWDPALDAVAAAPANHKVLFENDRLRVLEVTLEPSEEEPTHHHRWPSVFIFDQMQGPVHDVAPDGTILPPNRDVMKARRGTGRAGWSRIWRRSCSVASSTPPRKPSTASAAR